MKGRSANFTQVPLDIVGSTVFGRYPKISVEQTYNMIISDNFLVPYAGHKNVASVVPQSQGRGIFRSIRSNAMIAVIGNGVYAISNIISVNRVGTLDTFNGDVYIDENNNGEIAICDRQNIYVYNYVSGVFSKVSLDFLPGYISFQNGRFIAAVLGSSTWRLSDPNDSFDWPNDPQHTGTFQTKPDTVIAAQRFPGRGNLLFVFGSTVTEIWQDVGYQLFPYQRNSSLNIDYGCLNAATIAYNENIIVWLSQNEKSGPAIMYSTGGDPQRISTDGIDFKLSQLSNPSNSYGFLVRQDGHQLYQITFPDDNLSYVYDFNTKKFFTLCDEYMNAHIAKRICFFNNSYYFVSFKDGNIYDFDTQYTTYDGKEIPRIRVCRNIRLPDSSRFAINNLTFVLEQGTQEREIIDDYIVPQKVMLSVSKNGGESFGNIWSKELNARGKFKNNLNYWNLGSANDFVPQFRFWGLGRFVVTDGIVSIYQ